MGVGRRPTFNPTLVRLRQLPQGSALIGHTAFNPTLVRLRRGSIRGTSWGPARSFQSHLGSIAAPDAARPRGATARFQSHLGSIAASLRAPHRPLRPGSLSIPPWFDCGILNGPCRWCSTPLSIPPWFDCGGRLGPVAIDQIAALSIPPWFDCGP